MKKLLCFLLIAVILAVPVSAVGTLYDDDIGISAPSAVLMEKETGELLYEKNAHERLFPASVTKVMTMLLIVEDIDSGRLRLDDTVTASERAASFGGSCVYLEEGEQMSVDEMLKCIAVVSANDCAVAMAEHISGSEELFVRRMNERAAELGLENTHFTGCTGLFDDGEHYTTAYDIAVMSRELIKHELIKDYTTIWMDSIRDGAFGLNNTNKLVYWYPGCTGLKTGYTSTAMYCLAATAERDGVEYIAVILHGESVEQRNADAKKLLNYAFASYTLCPLTDGEPLPELPVVLGKCRTVKTELSGGGSILVANDGAQAEYTVELCESVEAPVHRGDRLGTVTLRRGGELTAVTELVAAEDVERAGLFASFGKILLALVGIY